MEISGIQQSSLVEYPGKIACILFSPGYNGDDQFFYHPQELPSSPMKLFQEENISEEEIFNFLEMRQGFLDAVAFRWGEPTTQEGLYQLIKKIKNLGFLIKLHSNGGNFSLIKKLIDQKLLDYLSIDIRPSIFDQNINQKSELFSDFLKEYQNLYHYLLEAKIDYHYQATLIKGFHSQEDLENILQQIQGIQQLILINHQNENSLNENTQSSFDEEEMHSFQQRALKQVQHCSWR